MEEPKTVAEKARVYTTHGAKKNQGMLAIVNCKVALAYTIGTGDNLQVVAYTYVDELMKRGISSELPQYQLDF